MAFTPYYPGNPGYNPGYSPGYQPGYQPGFYQQPAMDNLAQLRQNQINQQMTANQYTTPNQPQTMQSVTMPPASGIIWVQGEEGAKSYQVAPGNSVQLMDSENSVFYIKSVDASGMPLPLRIFDYVERQPGGNANRPTLPVESTPAVDLSGYVTQEEFDATKRELNALAAKLESISSARPVAKTARSKKEDTDNGESAV